MQNFCLYWHQYKQKCYMYFYKFIYIYLIVLLYCVCVLFTSCVFSFLTKAPHRLQDQTTLGAHISCSTLSMLFPEVQILGLQCEKQFPAVATFDVFFISCPPIPTTIDVYLKDNLQKIAAVSNNTKRCKM